MKTFAETPEGRKYLAKLQEGDGKRVPDGMDGLEAQAFKMFTKSRLRAGVLIAEREKTLQGIVEAEERVKALTRQGDIATGEARASAEILLAAEEARHDVNEKEPDILGDGANGDPDNEDRAPSTSRGEAEPIPGNDGVVAMPLPLVKIGAQV